MLDYLKPKSPLELWNKHRAEFLAIYASEQSDKITHKELEKWFIDSKGKQYYKFPKQMALPIERITMLQDFYDHLATGLSGDEQDKLISVLELIQWEGLKSPDSAVKLGGVIHILKERRALIFHTEVIYNILAVQAIREDETPDSVSNDIQREKVAQFKEEVAKSNSYFFFQQTQLETPINLLRLSPDKWDELWTESEAQQQAFPKILSLLHTLKKSKTEEPTSASS